MLFTYAAPRLLFWIPCALGFVFASSLDLRILLGIAYLRFRHPPWPSVPQDFTGILYIMFYLCILLGLSYLRILLGIPYLRFRHPPWPSLPQDFTGTVNKVLSLHPAWPALPQDLTWHTIPQVQASSLACCTLDFGILCLRFCLCILLGLLYLRI